MDESNNTPTLEASQFQGPGFCPNGGQPPFGNGEGPTFPPNFCSERTAACHRP